MPWTHRDNARANIYPAVVYLNTPYGSLDLCSICTLTSTLKYLFAEQGASRLVKICNLVLAY